MVQVITTINIKTVTRNFKPYDMWKTAELPAIMIVDDLLVTLTEMTALQYTTGAIERIDDGAGVTLIGLLRAEWDKDEVNTGIASSNASLLYSDIVIAMLADRTLNNIVENVSVATYRKNLDFVFSNRLAVCGC